MEKRSLLIRMFALLGNLGNQRRAWVALCLVTILCRLTFSFVTPHLGVLAVRENADGLIARGSDGYDRIARNLLAGNGYREKLDWSPTMSRNPGYVLFLTGLFAVVGHERWVCYVSQALIAGGVAVLIGRVGRPVIGSGPAFLAGTMYAFYPGDWFACVKYVVEPMLGLMLLTMLLVIRHAIFRFTITVAVLLGTIWGLMILTKSVAAYLPMFLLLWLFLFVSRFRIEWRRTVPMSILALATCGLVVLPWGAWNYQRSGHWVFTSSIVGWSLFDANYINMNRHRSEDRYHLWSEARMEGRRMAAQAGVYSGEVNQWPWSFQFKDIQEEYAMSEFLKKQAVADILKHPFVYGVGVLHGLGEFWYATRSRGSSIGGALINFPLLALAAFGFVAAGLWRNAEAVCWVGVVVYMNLITAMSLAVSRYAIPIMPIVLLLAAVGLFRLAGVRLKEKPMNYAGIPFEVSHGV